MENKNQKWLGLLAIIPAMAMIFLDQSILPVALPAIQSDLKASNLALEWSVNSYLLVLALFVLMGGKVSDQIGHRKAFLTGMALFAGASALCALSFHSMWLILARALQGIGAAIMVPSSMAILITIFPKNERGKATGINVSVSSVFAMLGPLVGGFLTENFSWRWIFWINLPVAIIGIILIFAFIPSSLPKKQKFDLKGFGYYLIAASCSIVAVMQGVEWGLLSWKSGAFLLAFIVSFWLLLSHTKKTAHPFFALSLYKHSVYKAASVSICITAFILMITVFWPIFFQEILGYSPFKSGLITCISTLPVLFTAPMAGFLSDRFGPKVPISIGFLMLIFSFIWMTFFNDQPLEIFFFALLAFGIGIPFILTPSFSSALSSIPPTQLGIGSGMLGTLRAFSNSLGVGIIGSFLGLIRSSRFQDLLENSSSADLLSSERSREILANPRAMSAEEISNMGPLLKSAGIDAFSSVNAVLACLLIVTFIAVLILFHRKSTHHIPETFAEGWD